VLDHTRQRRQEDPLTYRFQSLPVLLRMNSSNSGTVNAVSP
jgi:hypothetical protein